METLNANWIYPRRYFYPSLSTLDYVDKYEVPVSESVSKRVLCLPMYHSLKQEDIYFISRLLLGAQNN
jgi:dTDP-4-amino-4,6-dideoxygalactose transaminase